MGNTTVENNENNVIATVVNNERSDQHVDIMYLRDENAFVTSGIARNFAEKEIFIPAYLVVQDIQLIGAIVSTILEKISSAVDRDAMFTYASKLDVMGTMYSLSRHEGYIKLEKD